MQIGLGDPDTKTPQVMQERGACAGCDQYKKCLFNMPRHGGFKNQGPRYVAYALITDRSENSNGKEDFISCINFVEGLQQRILDGQAAAAAGRKGAEIVRLLLGRKTVTQGIIMGFNGRGEIIKPQPNQVEDLRRSGHNVNLDDKTEAVLWKLVKFEHVIPPYKAPSVTHSTYSEEMRVREAELQRSEIEDEDARYEERSKDRDAADLKRRGRTTKVKDDDLQKELDDDFNAGAKA